MQESIKYFAEFGLSAGTIELARRIGTTQPLLYKYFPTKDALIERVYERLIPQNWDPGWEAMLEDESIPLRTRLKSFYASYVNSVLTYEHVRLFLFSGLCRNEFNARYYSVLSERIFSRIIKALWKEYVGERRGDPTDLDLEFVQSLHGAIYHIVYRKHVHLEDMPDDLTKLVASKVDLYLDGAAQVLARKGEATGPDAQPAST